jgi:hypothetical protein
MIKLNANTMEQKILPEILNVKNKLWILIILFVTPTLTVIFPGCKKNTDKKTQCEITSVSSPLLGDTYLLTYDINRQLKRVTFGANISTYEYTPDKTTVTNLQSGVFQSKTVITFNSSGLALNVRSETNTTGTEWTNDAFEYNGVELAKSTTTSSAGGTPGIVTYTWVNQNMRSATSPAGTSVYEYYTDKPRQAGDFLSLVQLIQGYEIYRNKNLIKNFAGSDFIYEFGSDGNISSVKVTSGTNISFLDYQYQCH